jgi:hypothetical protein
MSELDKYYIRVKEPKPLTRTQTSIYILIHGAIIFIVPIILIEEFILDDIIKFVIILSYIITLPYISILVHKHITRKLIKLIVKDE